MFDIQAGFGVGFEYLRITGGHVYWGGAQFSGGGILNDGTLVMVNSTVVDNGTPFVGHGGGVYNRGRFTMEHCSVGYDFTCDSSDATDVGVGGGIYNAGMLVMTYSVMISNSTGTNTGSGEGGEGGGIYNSSCGPVTLNRSSVVHVCLVRVMRIMVWMVEVSEWTLMISTSTISSNLAGSVLLGSGDYYGGSGGGIATIAPGTITITDSTIARNVSGESSGCGISAAGGLFISGGSFTLGNTILADNLADYSWDCFGTMLSAGYNLVGSVSGCSISGDLTGNITGQDPMLASLVIVDNVNFVHRLLLGSPVIDAGPNCCGISDQRLLSRPKDGDGDGTATCDMGAYETYLWQFLPLMVMP